MSAHLITCLVPLRLIYNQTMTFIYMVNISINYPAAALIKAVYPLVMGIAATGTNPITTLRV